MLKLMYSDKSYSHWQFSREAKLLAAPVEYSSECGRLVA